MASKQDYYETLAVARGASPEDVKKSYRKLAMKFHPDRNPGDQRAEQRFKEISEAYDVLKDDQRRAAYDRFGHAAFENGANGFAGGRAHGFDFAGGFADIFDEMFGEFTGRGRGHRAAARGADLRYNLEIALDEAFAGKSATIRVGALAICDPCAGTGAEAGSRPVTCPTCHGRGKVRATQGFFTIERTCPSCHGQGQIIDRPCRNCQGHGRVQRERTLKVDIPAGVEDGTRIRLAGEGEAGLRGAPPGDLYIFLSVQSHAFFQRDGANIHCRVPIAMVAASLGGAIEVPTLGGGRAKVTIPPGAQSGHQFRLKGKGMPVLRSAQAGDMYIQVNVETPVNLSRRQREILKEFNEEARNNSPESEGFFAKAKAFWDGFGS